MKSCRVGWGFTLVELLVVIGIIAVLIAIITPVYNTAKVRQKEGVCRGNLQQLGIALKAYAADHHAYPPPPYYDGTRYYGGLSSLYPDYITDKALFLCPADQATKRSADTAKEKVYCSYNGMIDYNTWQFELNAASRPLRLYNYFGYTPDGDGNSEGYDLFNGADYPSPTNGYALPGWLAAEGLTWRFYPRLMNRHAPGNTIVAHCPHHREYYGDVLREMDPVLHLSGNVDKVLVSKMSAADATGVAPWVHQR